MGKRERVKDLNDRMEALRGRMDKALEQANHNQLDQTVQRLSVQFDVLHSEYIRLVCYQST